jgi:predicted kinase
MGMPGNMTSRIEQSHLSQDIRRLRESLGVLPEAVVSPAFVVVSGLPGTGKSFFCRKLAEKMPSCVLESDALRKFLFPSPDYSAAESARLFSACHSLIEQLLEEGVPVIFDATNLSERHREHLYRISGKTGAKLILVRVEAPADVVYSRLQTRDQSVDKEDKSDADWDIYRRMKPAVDRIHRNHFVVDTSRDITPVIDKVIRAINR